MSQEDKRRLKKIKSSVFERTLSLTKFTLGATSKVLGHNLTTLFDETDLKSEKWRILLSQSAKSLSQELGELKGSLMKAGQMISMYGELFLPPEANEFLKTLQSQSPAVEFSQIQPILKNELGDRIQKLEVEENPIGAASLGQVHRARLKTHENISSSSSLDHSPKDRSPQEMALKIQYPGVENAIKSDLKSLRSLLKLLNLLPSDFQSDVLFEEVETMLRQELDYKLEQEQTKLYRQKLQGDSRFIIPQVFSEWSTSKVIATSYEQGLAVDHPLVRSLSQDRRNQIGISFLDLYFMELFEWGLVQTDPHLGNYKVRLATPGSPAQENMGSKDSAKLRQTPDHLDQLVLLDFGAVRTYPDSFLIPYRKMIKAAILRDSAQLEKASLELQLIQKEDPPQLKKLFVEFCYLTVEPFLPPQQSNSPFMSADGIYDWKNSDLPKRLTQIGLQIVREFPLRTPPREIVFLDRKTGGVFIFLAVVGAKIKASEIIQKYIEKI